uniref:Uncharacterized protein n=1 Tax=Schistosoma curassoni TaxID=6186 RepID=A0A183JJR2_9TREM
MNTAINHCQHIFARKQYSLGTPINFQWNQDNVNVRKRDCDDDDDISEG